ncbi:AMP-dependent synthetase and ligase [Martensiomyces pterosporus]|nr:AMP-dependent synthetase and ligase [Martensiomyces pterosporus]
MSPNRTPYLQEIAHQRSISNPQEFWLQQATELLDWAEKPTRATDAPGASSEHKAVWFPDGKLNVCYNAVDRHALNGRGDQVAVIYDSPVTDTVKKFTYSELLREVKGFASVLRRRGVQRGDTVLLYMAMVPQTLIAMLACARLGAIHSVVFGGFAPPELAKRIRDCRPKVILTNTCGLESKAKIVAYKPLLDRALELAAYRPEAVIVLQREQLRVPLDQKRGEYYWDVELAEASRGADGVECEFVESGHPLYMLYTSGTTGMPKGVVRPSGGHAVSLLYAQRNMYGLQPGETMFTFSDFGWALGHGYAAYGPLLNGSTTVLFEGKPVGTPDAGQIYRVFSQHNVRVFLCAPTVVVVLRRADPDGLFRAKYDLTHMRGLFLAGERCTPEIQRWWISLITGRKPSHEAATAECGDEICNVVSDHWWQTESGAPLTGICIGLSDSGKDIVPIKYGSAGLPLPGVDLHVIRLKDCLDEDEGVDESPELADCGEVGNIVLRLPLPPGSIATLWNDNERFFDSYFRRYPGFYDTGDTGMVDSDGYVHILSRTDDVIKVAAHRLSTSTIEEVVFEHSAIVECCVVARPDPIKGSVPMVFAVLKANTPQSAEQATREELVQQVRARVGPIVSLYAGNVVFVDRLPKTRSGKILRKMIRVMVDVCPVSTPPTIDDENVKSDIWNTIVGLFSA